MMGPGRHGTWEGRELGREEEPGVKEVSSDPVQLWLIPKGRS